MKPDVRVYLLDDAGERFFGKGPYQLLQGVERLGSLNAAASELGMAYTKALKLINRAESALGYSLTERTAGGVSGGGTRLTKEGKELLIRYGAYLEACRASNRRIYQEIFGI